MCDRRAIRDKGKLVAMEKTKKIIDRIQTKKINFKVTNIDKNKILKIKGIEITVNSNQSITLSYDKNSINFSEVIKYFNENNIKISCMYLGFVIFIMISYCIECNI